jgi:cytochrome c oxidase subunit I
MQPFERLFWRTFFPQQFVDDPLFHQNLEWFLGRLFWQTDMQLRLLSVISIVAVVLIVKLTIKAGQPFRFTIIQLWLLGAVFLCFIAGFTGVILTNSPVDRTFKDTYYIVSHFHYAFSIVLLFAAFGGWYHLFPKLTGYLYNVRLAQIHFWTTFIGANLTFFPQHFLGLTGARHRVPNYTESTVWNTVSSLGSYLAGAATVFFVITMVHAYFIARKSAD